MRIIKQGESTSLKIFITTTDNVTGATALTPTIAYSLTGAGFTTVNAPASTETDYGWYDVALTTNHTGTLGDVAFHSTGAGQGPVDFKIRVVPADWQEVSDVYSAEFGHWRVDTTADTLTIFRSGDTTTSVQVFSLTRQTGTQPYYSERTT